jgi:hypothetical protein
MSMTVFCVVSGGGVVVSDGGGSISIVSKVFEGGDGEVVPMLGQAWWCQQHAG